MPGPPCKEDWKEFLDDLNRFNPISIAEYAVSDFNSPNVSDEDRIRAKTQLEYTRKFYDWCCSISFLPFPVATRRVGTRYEVLTKEGWKEY